MDIECKHEILCICRNAPKFSFKYPIKEMDRDTNNLSWLYEEIQKIFQ